MTTDTIEPVLVTLKPGAGLKQEPALHIPLGLLAPSPTNPRRKFDAAKLNELAEGIRELGGVFQPVLARHNPAFSEGNGQPRYEIVAGERRWRASKIAGMETLLTLVRDLTDAQALQIQLKENIDRESLHALEEAEGIRRLMATTGATIKEVMHILSKSRRWVFNRLSLLDLCDEVRQAFLADEFMPTIALLVSTIVNPADQIVAYKHIVAGFGGEPLTFRAAEAYVRKEFMLRLSNAPFDIEATYHIAGPCSQCTKRTGANPDLFGEADVKAGDSCQDRACFHAKAGEQRDKQMDAARAAGHTVLEGEAASKLMPTPSVAPHGFLWLDQAQPGLTDDTRTLREIFGAKQRDAITLELSNGEIVSIVPEEAVRKILKAQALLRQEAPKPKRRVAELSPEAPKHTQQEVSQLAAKAPASPKPQPLSPLQQRAAVDSCSSELFSEMLAKQLAAQIDQADDLPLLALRIAIERLMDDASAEASKLVFTQMGWPEGEHGAMRLSALRPKLASLGGDDLGRMFVYSLYAEAVTEGYSLEDMQSYSADNPALLLAAHYGIDTAALQAEADEGAETIVRNRESRRLGEPVNDAPADATEAFVKTHAPAPSPAPAAKFLPAWPFPSPPPAGYAPREPAAASKPGIKYRNPGTGETWSGRGLQPKWLKARLAEGGRLEDFLL
ncbi:ParB/RepB/Spo0J family partition protein [Roseateles cavernae]|uniref:ParB/RepB/Spo0J family partition protein n=1 Tax=Roseateles cavernae TaxID=3153578 RepID=UPI0032E3C4E0